MQELCFVISTSIIENHPQMNELLKKVYTKHLEHIYSRYAGEKTTQYPLGLRDCNENRTQDVIQLLKELSKLYVPCKNDTIVEPVFGGDRLTDESVQSAQEAMKNAETPLDRLEGFISKIEDIRRMMNFLETIHKLTYNSQSGSDRCTYYYFRNLLNLRNVKGKVCNSFRAYKMLYYVILDAVCLAMFLAIMNSKSVDEEIEIPEDFDNKTDKEKTEWIDGIRRQILKKWFFEGSDDICENLREIFSNPDHPDNYWISNMQDNGRSNAIIVTRPTSTNTQQYHEKKYHDVNIEKLKPKQRKSDTDVVNEYILMLFD